MKTFHSFLLFALLACVLKGFVAAVPQTCCTACTSADSFSVPNSNYVSSSPITCPSNEYVSISLTIGTTNDDSFQVYTVNSANYALYANNDQFNYIVSLSTGNTDHSCFTASGTDGVSSEVFVLYYCHNNIESCELDAIVTYNCNSYPTTPPPTTAPTTTTPTTTTPTTATPTTTTPTTATGTTPTTTPTSATGTTTTPHSISSRLGSSISGGLIFLIAIVCAVLSF